MSQSKSPFVIIFLFCCLVYFNTLQNGFQLDDHYRVVDNPGIQKILPASRHFIDPKTIAYLPSLEVYRPLLPLSLSLNYALHEYSPAGYHLVNAGIHFLTTLLAYLLCLAITQMFQHPEKAPPNAKGMSLMVALVFAAHPVSGYPVNYISGRDLLMMQFFLIASFYCYIRMNKKGENLFRWASVLALYLLSLLSKQNALVMPVLILAFEVILMKQPLFNKTTWYRVLPFALLAAGLTLFIKLVLGFSDVDKLSGRSEWSSFWVYPLTQLKVHLFGYGTNFLWPWGMSASPYVTPGSIVDPGVWIGFVFIVATLFVAYQLRKTMPVVSFCILAYWVLLAPSSSLMPLTHLQFDYRPYPSSVFLYLAVATLAFKFLDRNTVLAGSLAVLIYFSTSAIQFNSIWKTNETFWGHSIDSGGSLAHLNYAMAVKDLSIREKHLRTALDMNPKYVMAKMNLGLTLIYSGKSKEGLNWVETSAREKPYSGQTQFWLSKAYNLTGDTPKALLASSRAAKLKPIKQYQYEAGLQLIRAERFEEALSFLNPVLHEYPYFKRTGYLIGFAYQKTGQNEEAISVYEAYLKNDKQDSQALFNLGYAYMDTDRCLDSIEAFNKTLDQKPDYDEVHLHLSTCHKKLGNMAQSDKHLHLWHERSNK